MQNSTQALDSFLPSPLIHYFLLFVAQGGTVFLEAKTFKAQEPTSEELAANLTQFSSRPPLFQVTLLGKPSFQTRFAQVPLFHTSMSLLPKSWSPFAIGRFFIVWAFGYCSLFCDLKNCEAALCFTHIIWHMQVPTCIFWMKQWLCPVIENKLAETWRPFRHCSENLLRWQKAVFQAEVSRCPERKMLTSNTYGSPRPPMYFLICHT